MNDSRILVTFCDGLQRNFLSKVTPLYIAQNTKGISISSIVAAYVNNKLWDLCCPIYTDCFIKFITIDQDEALDIIRHDAAHLMAEAVMEVYPETKLVIGPNIKDGFYYDFFRDRSFVLEDLDVFEKKMYEIIKRNEKIVREIWDRKKAINFFQDIGEKFKVYLIENLPLNEKIVIYKQGNFVDLCRGPHLPSTGYLSFYFKLMKLSGSYWRGDSKNIKLQRIYGTAWLTNNDLTNYLNYLEELKKRDHRKLGREMNLFHQQDEAIGNVFWHSNGWSLYRVIEDYIRTRLKEDSYHEVKTPLLLDHSLWKKSGHWDKFRVNIFTVQDNEGKTLVLKPMNCPAHVQIFQQCSKSYRDLPFRITEFGTCHRNEPSGALHGLFRLSAFVQDDAHIFCSQNQINSETKKFCYLLISIYKDFGFSLDDILVKFADRPKVRAGDDSVWDKAEDALSKAINVIGLKYCLNPGAGAFYGPKLEFILKDAIGREWQCGTLQVDFILPEQLNISYLGKNGNKLRPVILHRAILGSLERFIGILIEHCKGRLPLWLAPIQVALATITNISNFYVHQIEEQLKKINIRFISDLRNEKISYKIRKFYILRVPEIIVIGKSEMKNRTITVRRFGVNNQEVLELDDWIDKLKGILLPPSMR